MLTKLGSCEVNIGFIPFQILFSTKFIITFLDKSIDNEMNLNSSTKSTITQKPQ